MKRDPVLHVKRSDLIDVLNSIAISNRTTGIKLADAIFKGCQPVQLTDRYLKVLQNKAATKKKMSRSMEADDVPDSAIEKMNLLIATVRQKQNPNAKIKGIMKNSNQYLLLKEITKMAYDFVGHFDIEPVSEGLKEFTELGISFMGRYALNRFKTYESRIYESFESKVKVLTDPNKDATQNFYMSWQRAMMEYSSIVDFDFIDKDMVKFSHMVYGREAADTVRADYDDWILAQFEGLSFMNVIPEIYQLYGENAKKRYDNYKSSEIKSKKNDVTGIYKNMSE